MSVVNIRVQADLGTPTRTKGQKRLWGQQRSSVGKRSLEVKKGARGICLSPKISQKKGTYLVQEVGARRGAEPEAGSLR